MKRIPIVIDVDTRTDDAVAIVCPEVLTFKKYYMTVECGGEITRGMTIADFNNVARREPNVWAAVDIDAERFWNWLTTLLA